MKTKRKINIFILSLICLFVMTTSIFSQEDPNIPVTDIYRPSESLLDYSKANEIEEILKLPATNQTTASLTAPKVAVIGSCNNTVWRNDVVSKLSATGFFSQIDGYDGYSSTPTLATLQQYAAVLVYSDCGFQNNVAMGNVLADYADSGGGVVLTTFVFWAGQPLGLQGRIVSGGYMPFTQGQQNGGFDLSLVKDNSTHPILNGVNTFLGGTSSYHNNPIVLTSGANLIAHWSNGQPLVGTKETNGKRVVGLNMYPPSSSIRSDMWRANTDGGRLMANSLLWSAHQSTCSAQNVLIIYDTNNGDTQALKTALENNGMNVTLSQTSEPGYNGTNPNPIGFDAVIHLNGTTYGSDMPVAGQQALVNYVQNGGAYLQGEWDAYDFSIGGMQLMRDLILFDRTSGTQGSFTVTEIAAQSSHPLLSNIPATFTFTGGINIGSIHNFAVNPVTVLMRDQLGNDAVGVRQFGNGRIVGFHHAGNYGNYGTLLNVNIQQLYIDGIKWASETGGCGNPNSSPTAVADSYSTDEDTSLSIPANGILGNDTDAENNALTAAIVTNPANAASFTFNANGSFDYTPDQDFNGTDSFTYKANDGQADSNTVIVTITVNAINDAPSLSGVPSSATINELAAYGFTASANDIDSPSSSLQFSLVGAPAGAAIDASTGLFAWTPDETQGPGNYPFIVRVSDGSANTDAAITITVNEVNSAPSLSNVPASATIDELALYSFTAASSDADIPVQTLTFSLVGAPSGASIGSSSGVFNWTPTEAQGNGSAYNFTVRVSDGVTNTDAPVSLTVNEVNSAPVLNAISDKTVDEETLLSVPASAGDSDDPANVLTYSLDAGFPAGMTIDSSSGAISWTPSEAQGVGDYPVTVRVTDNGTGNLSDTKTFNVHVNEVNVAPILTAIGNSTIDEQVAFGLTATASDADLPANNLTFSLVGAPAGASITAGGAFSWTPSEAQGPGSYTFTVKVTDDGAPNLSDEEQITITVNEVNRPPVLAAISNQTGYWGNAFGFTATATDPDIPVNTLTFSLIGAPAGASINPSSGLFAWTPTSLQIGSHTFTVRVTDNGSPNLYDEKSVTINVGKRPTALVYTGDAGEQYSDRQALSATLTDNGGGAMQGLPLSGKTVGFAIGTQNTSASTNGSGAAVANLILTQDPAPAYTVGSSFAGDSDYLPSSDSDAFDILQEDARAYYTGTLFVNTSCATCSSGTATLSATVKDITAETSDSAYDVFAGDIRNAKVTFVDRDTNMPIAGCSNLSVGLVNLADPKTGTATCNWNVNIGSADSMDYTVGIIVNNYYTRNASVDNSVLTVSKPIGTNFITGGGYLVNALSNGQYAGVTGLKTNFGFNVKYNNSGKSLQGRVNVIVRGNNGRTYQIKGNVMRTLSVRTVTNNPLVTAAVYTGKANMTDITDPLNPITLGGNNSFQMEMTDKGEPGSTDSIGITVWNDAGGLLFSSRWDGTRSVEQVLGGGNLVVR